MFVPRKATATMTIVDNYCIYLLARLEADPKTRHLERKFNRAVSMLEKLHVAERKAYRALKIAEARRDHADDEALLCIRFFHGALLGHAGGDRSSIKYWRFFKHGLTPVTEASPDRRLDLMGRLERSPLDANASAHLQTGQGDLARARAELETRAGQLLTAFLDHRDARRREVFGRGDWQEAYRTIYASVMQIFPSDNRKVESFFHKGPKRRKTAEEAESAERT